MPERPKRYIDSCVLIAALRDNDPDVTQRAIDEISDPDVDFLYSSIVKFEVLPGPMRVAQHAGQLAFFEDFFERATCVDWHSSIEPAVLRMMSQLPLSVPDAMHVAFALAANATEMVTAEGRTKPMLQLADTIVRTIRI